MDGKGKKRDGSQVGRDDSNTDYVIRDPHMGTEAIIFQSEHVMVKYYYAERGFVQMGDDGLTLNLFIDVYLGERCMATHVPKLIRTTVPVLHRRWRTATQRICFIDLDQRGDIIRDYDEVYNGWSLVAFCGEQFHVKHTKIPVMQVDYRGRSAADVYILLSIYSIVERCENSGTEMAILSNDAIFDNASYICGSRGYACHVIREMNELTSVDSNGGYDAYLQDLWNQMMHGSNGNTIDVVSCVGSISLVLVIYCVATGILTYCCLRRLGGGQRTAYRRNWVNTYGKRHHSYTQHYAVLSMLLCTAVLVAFIFVFPNLTINRCLDIPRVGVIKRWSLTSEARNRAMHSLHGNIQVSLRDVGTVVTWLWELVIRDVRVTVMVPLLYLLHVALTGQFLLCQPLSLNHGVFALFVNFLLWAWMVQPLFVYGDEIAQILDSMCSIVLSLFFIDMEVDMFANRLKRKRRVSGLWRAWGFMHQLWEQYSVMVVIGSAVLIMHLLQSVMTYKCPQSGRVHTSRIDNRSLWKGRSICLGLLSLILPGFVMLQGLDGVRTYQQVRSFFLAMDDLHVLVEQLNGWLRPYGMEIPCPDAPKRAIDVLREKYGINILDGGEVAHAEDVHEVDGGVNIKGTAPKLEVTQNINEINQIDIKKPQSYMMEQPMQGDVVEPDIMGQQGGAGDAMSVSDRPETPQYDDLAEQMEAALLTHGGTVSYSVKVWPRHRVNRFLTDFNALCLKKGIVDTASAFGQLRDWHGENGTSERAPFQDGALEVNGRFIPMELVKSFYQGQCRRFWRFYALATKQYLDTHPWVFYGWGRKNGLKDNDRCYSFDWADVLEVDPDRLARLMAAKNNALEGSTYSQMNVSRNVKSGTTVTESVRAGEDEGTSSSGSRVGPLARKRRY